MFVSSRWLFLAAWVFPALCLIGGGLPPERIAAAMLAAALSGLLVAALPVAAFRLARLAALLVFPLVWLWIAYASLDGTGPNAESAIAAISNTTAGESIEALRLGLTPRSATFGALSLGLLVASFLCGAPPRAPSTNKPLAAALLSLMAIAWLPRTLADVPAFLPGRDDLQNYPYGTLLDLLAAFADHRVSLSPRQAIHRTPSEAHVPERIDSIFVLGETYRFVPLATDPAAAYFAARFQGGLGAFLPKVCASADTTAVSVPMLLTGSAPQRHEEAATAPSGLARLAAAGYDTAWISNQGRLDFFNDEKRGLLWSAKGYATQYDEGLIPIAALALNRNPLKNKGLLLHLMDSHAPYEERYPHRAEPDGVDAEEQDRLRYRRANEHTLQVLQRIAELVDHAGSPAFAVYVSDHGENILADHNGIRFHAGARTTVEAGYVPAMVFWNEAFGRRYDPVGRLQKLLDAPVLAHADIYRLWMSLSGLPADLTPTTEPRILGKAHLTDPVGAIPCATLSP